MLELHSSETETFPLGWAWWDEAVCTPGRQDVHSPGVSPLHPRPVPGEEPRPGAKWTVPGVTCPPAQLSDGCQPVCLEQPWFRLPDPPQRVSRPPPMAQEKPWDGPLSDPLAQRAGPREDVLHVGMGARDALFPESVQLMCCSHHSVFSSGVSASLRPRGLQHVRHPCLSLSLRVCSN